MVESKQGTLYSFPMVSLILLMPVFTSSCEWISDFTRADLPVLDGGLDTADAALDIADTGRDIDAPDGGRDGETDEDVTGLCIVGEQEPCGTDVGECELGEKECLEGGTWSECMGSVTPVGEICDGLDNDCDESTDEDFDLQNDTANCGACGHACTGGYAHVLDAGCFGGICRVLCCENEYFDMDNDLSTGCEQTCRVGYTYERCESEYTERHDDNCDGRIDETCGGRLVGSWGSGDWYPMSGCEYCTRFYDWSAIDPDTVQDDFRVLDRELIDACLEGIFGHPEPYFGDYALGFDGVDDWGYIENSASSPDLNEAIAGAFTFMLWVKPFTLEDGDYVVWREPGDRFSMKMANVDGDFKWSFCLSGSACGATRSDIILHAWTQLAFVYENTNLDIYVNGIYESSFSGSFVPGGEMRMGGNGTSSYFHGGIDEIGLFSVALSQDEILDHYHQACGL